MCSPPGAFDRVSIKANQVNTGPAVYPIVVIDHRNRLSYAAGALETLWDARDAFLQERRRCEQMNGGAEAGRVWMTCGCGAEIAQPLHRKSKDR
jgi:hypothetical protein